jgi:hypothetical protein
MAAALLTERHHELWPGPMRRLAWPLSERRLDRKVGKRAGGDGLRPGFFSVAQQAGQPYTRTALDGVPRGVRNPFRINSSPRNAPPW